MNLYKFHSDPKTLIRHDEAQQSVPDLFSPLGKIGSFPGNLTPRQIKAISKDAWQAYSYASAVLKKGWPEAESYIMKDPASAYHYAIEVIDGPWPEAEPYIMKDPEYAIFYAIDVLEEPWPEAEKYIKQDKAGWKEYKEYFGL